MTAGTEWWTTPIAALGRSRARRNFSEAELKEAGRMAVEEITALNNQTGAADLRSAAPESPTTTRRSKDMATISDGHEDISIVGTGISKIPGKAHPEFAGLRVGEDGIPVARIEDGALVIEVDDLDLAIAWRNVWHQAAAHLTTHRERKADRP